MNRLIILAVSASLVVSVTQVPAQQVRTQTLFPVQAPRVLQAPPVQELGAPRLPQARRSLLPQQPSLQSASHSNLKMGLKETKNEPVKQVMTKRVDFRKAISKLAVEKGISETDARLEALMLLRLNPMRREMRIATSGATFELVDVDQFEITADETYFEQLPYLINCLEMGMKQVAIQCRIVQIDSKKSNRMNAFLKSTEINCGTIPSVTPVATAGPSDEVSPASFVTTSTVVRENSPATTGQVMPKQLKQMTAYLKKSNAAYQFSPTVVTYPGQTGTISDVAHRPFVVGLEKIRGEGSKLEAFQPLVQTLGDGTTVNVRGIPRGGSIQLMGDVSMAQVVDTKNFSFATSGEKERQFIQIPRQVLRQIHFSATLKPDVAYYIDPNFETQDSEPSRTVFLFQAKLIDMQPTTRVAEKK